MTCKSSPQKKGVFLDRDGVINSGGLINKPADLVLIPGVVEAIASLKQAGYVVGVVTNQGGLSEDLNGNVTWKNAPMNRAALASIHAELLRLLGPTAQPDFIKFCPHAKKVDCECRKPKAGMLRDAASEFDIDVSKSFMVGDMATDIQAGINAGATPLFVLSGFEPQQKDKCPAGTLVFPSLVEAAAFILSK